MLDDDEKFAFWDDEEAGYCLDCGEETHILTGPDHPPYDAEAHWHCESHVRPDYAVVRVTDDGVETIREANHEH